LAGGNKFDLVVMANLFNSKVLLHQKFDLKGSTLGRTAGNASLDDPHEIYKVWGEVSVDLLSVFISCPKPQDLDLPTPPHSTPDDDDDDGFYSQGRLKRRTNTPGIPQPYLCFHTPLLQDLDLNMSVLLGQTWHDRLMYQIKVRGSVRAQCHV
jgi:hypothetical protein